MFDFVWMRSGAALEIGSVPCPQAATLTASAAAIGGLVPMMFMTRVRL
ncbi:hypothetical protein H8A95_34715 [Bradyrhizobium sp. Pear76]|nr:hypothetical protein [Bradyrhizobium oropedii]MCC8967343.1 hypothetical protein [Bradyrhizobium oropedii]